MQNVRRAAVLALMGALITCPSFADTPPASFYRLVDLTKDYSDFFDQASRMPADARVTAFKAAMEHRFPGFYSREAAPWLTPAQYDASIAASFVKFPKVRAAYEQKAAGFKHMLDPALASFRRTFPDMRPIGDIYLVHSVGTMDGGTRLLRNNNYFIFGADVMAQVHRFDDETPFFHHELFHVYHHQFFADKCEPVWCSLWMEGLAVLVASRLTPGASDDQLLLTSPQSLRQKVDAHLVEAVCAVRARLKSEKTEDYSALFSGQQLNERLPPRFGYYVGYRVARESHRKHSLDELAHLTVAEAEPIVHAALSTLASCAH